MFKEDLALIRDYCEDDKAFIVKSWSKGIYYGNKWFRSIDFDAFWAAYPPLIEKLIVRSKIRIASLKEDPQVILAFCVTEKDDTIMHFIFTKYAFRNIGLARWLYPKTITTFTHLTETAYSLWPEGTKFDPFKL